MEWSIDIESKAAVCGDDDTLRNPSTPSSESRPKDKPDTPRVNRITALPRWIFGKLKKKRTGEEDQKLPMPEVFIRKLQDCPIGYPRLAAFLDSDENFMIYRRFGYAGSRLLLHKQAELQKLEAAMIEMDEDDERDRPGCLQSVDLESDPSSPRARLMKDLETKYDEWGKLLNTAKELSFMSRPSGSEYRSVRNYLHATRPLCEDEEPRIDCKEDLVTLRRGREYAWLDVTIERLLKLFRCRAVDYFFRSTETRRKADDDGVSPVYYTRSRIASVVLFIVTTTVVALLIVPIYLLYHLTNGIPQGPHTTAVSMGTLVVFTLIFSWIVAFFSSAKRHEILLAAAAYCAVLVVFFGNVQVIYPDGQATQL
ncbi:MAG: hypothetical protein M1822_007304 [Bathelium mastoideum]|nr:MAG: hypothetical protein M1822_007304 [Bathelium mastoideum]